MKGKPDSDAHCFKHAFSHPSSEQCPYCRIAELESRITISEDQSRRLDNLTRPMDAPIRHREMRARRMAEQARVRIREQMPDILAEFERAKAAVKPIIDREAENERLQPVGEGWKA